MISFVIKGTISDATWEIVIMTSKNTTVFLRSLKNENIRLNVEGFVSIRIFNVSEIFTPSAGQEHYIDLYCKDNDKNKIGILEFMKLTLYTR